MFTEAAKTKNGMGREDRLIRATNGRASMSGELKRSPCLNQFLEEFKYIFEI